MDNYNSYGNSQYGSGGGGGGGFMPGEMNSPAGGKGDFNNNTLRPITVKQALDASQPYPEANYQIDGADVSSLCFIGQVRNISSQSTNVTYKIDDGTGEIEAKQWIDSTTADTMDTDDGAKGPGKSGKDQVELNGYAKIFGKLKAFGNKRFVGAHSVRPVTDINELHFHLLEAAAVHLFFTRGPPGGAGGNAAGGAGAGDASMGGVDDYGAAGNRALPAMTPAAKRVYNLLKTEPQNNEGLHVQMIAAKLGLPLPDVARAGDELLTAGMIFPTVDEQTWALLDY
ncbi:putative replication factor-a protein [Aspergillus melleus]|uniref:putative replication factor-a protein n=1 Tax=Aspergillus melleus TaxID=138277 RepID=UPI001E8D36B1|nr:Replication factor A protein 2 [Aspergillus melleus]KAH8433413.1 Replication factor A protein 2 [Aspergillus melleus]